MNLVSAILAFALLATGDDPEGPDKARFELRPSLVQVGRRSLKYVEGADWKRVSASLQAVLPLARSLDEKWNADIERSLREASENRHADGTMQAVLRLVYWDTVDLLAPLEQVGETPTPKELRTRLLKAQQGLRFLGPVIEETTARDDEGELVNGRVVFVQLDRLLSNSANYLPSNRRYGQSPDWKSKLATDIPRFRATLALVLPDLHGTLRSRAEDSR